MTTHTTEAPPEPDGDGPRVTRDEVRDLARLRRSRDDRKIAGVAGGLARHLDVDPIIPRVLLAVLVFFGGAGILLYAALWLFVPTEGTEEVPVRLDERSRTVVLIVVGAVAALALVGDSFGGWQTPWPAVAIAVGVLVVLLVRGGEPRLHPLLREAPPAPPGATTYGSTAYPPAPARRRGPVLFWYALALIALGTGVLGIVDTAGAEVAGSAYPAVALGTCAVLLVLGAFWGRAGGLILLGLVAAVATAGATVAGEVDAGHLEATPRTALAVQDRYELGVGEIDLDLTRVSDLPALDGRTVEVDLELAGRIEVRVPEGLDVVVRSSVEAGETRLFGDEVGHGQRRTTDDGGGADTPELTLDLSTVFGEIEVIREDVDR